jgi:hypothetical protein
MTAEGVRVNPESLRAGQGSGSGVLWALWIALAALAAWVLFGA